MTMRTVRLLPLLVLPIIALMGCSKDDNNHVGPGMGTMQVRMTDAPGDYDAVNLVVRRVEVYQYAASDTDSTAGWVTLSTGDSATYDLIQLQNGVFRTIGSGALASGSYSQMRLVLGAGSTVVVDGVTYPLRVPSGMQSGLKIIGPFQVTSGGTTDVLLDFDASRSIIQTGNGQYILKPVIHVLPAASAGAIRGTVTPTGITAWVTAMAGPDTMGTTSVASNGTFMINVLPAGTYSVTVDADSGYRDTTLTNIHVTSGSTTNVGTINLSATSAALTASR